MERDQNIIFDLNQTPPSTPPRQAAVHVLEKIGTSTDYDTTGKGSSFNEFLISTYTTSESSAESSNFVHLAQRKDREGKRKSSSLLWRGSDEMEKAKIRRRWSSNGQNLNIEEHLITDLERNTSLLDEHVEAHKSNVQLNMEQHKEQHENLMTVLTKISDVIETISNKL